MLKTDVPVAAADAACNFTLPMPRLAALAELALAGIAAAPHGAPLLPARTPLPEVYPRGETHAPVQCSPAVQLHDQLAAAVVVHKLELADVPCRRQNALLTPHAQRSVLS